MTNDEKHTTRRGEIAFRSYFAIALLFVGGVAQTLFEPTRIPGLVFFGLGCLFIGFAVNARSRREGAATAGSDGGAATASGDHDGADGGGAGGGD